MGSGHCGVHRCWVNPCLGGSLCAGRRLDHLRSDEPQCRRLQSDPRRRRARHPAGNAGGRQFRGNDRRLSGDVGGGPHHSIERLHCKHLRPPLRIKVRKGSAQKLPGFIPPRSRKMPPLRGLLLHRRVQAGQLAENRADYGTDAEFFVRVLLDIPVTPSLVNAVEQKGFVTLAGFTCLCCLPGESQATGLQCLSLASPRLKTASTCSM